MSGISCRFIEDHLEEVLEGTLSPETLASVQSHRTGCASCQRLLDLLEGKCLPMEVDLPPEWPRVVLELTSGVPCKRVQSRLGSWVDRDLPTEESELFQQHVEHCPDCRPLSEILTELKTVLPAMAQVRPDSGFCASVLAATVDQPSWRSRAVKGWQRLLERPRIAWEAAYLGTLLVLGVFSIFPFSGGGMLAQRLGISSVRSLSAWESICRTVSSPKNLELEMTTRVLVTADASLGTAKLALTRSASGLSQIAIKAWKSIVSAGLNGTAKMSRLTSSSLRKVRLRLRGPSRAAPS